MISQLNSSIAHTALGDYQQALDALNDALGFMTRINDRARVGVIRYCEGACYQELGDLPRARQAAEEALAIFRELSDPNFEIETLGLLGLIARDEGTYREAREHFTAGLRVAEVNEQAWDATVQRSYLALTLLLLGEAEEARRLATQVTAELERLEKPLARLPTVYFACYQVFAAVAGLTAARPYLENAHRALQDAADRISDPDLRRSFLENVADHRAIITAYRLGRPPAIPQRQTVRLPAASALTSRPLREDEWREVSWTVAAPEDEEVSDKSARRQRRLLREAAEQGAAPTVDDLAEALAVSRATIKRDLAELRQTGHEVRTRGSRSQYTPSSNAQSKIRNLQSK